MAVSLFPGSRSRLPVSACFLENLRDIFVEGDCENLSADGEGAMRSGEANDLPVLQGNRGVSRQQAPPQSSYSASLSFTL